MHATLDEMMGVVFISRYAGNYLGSALTLVLRQTSSKLPSRKGELLILKTVMNREYDSI
jgi:hypothetical protein